ncbi:MAG: TetR/AcrR family transcriptional regulator [Hyphomonadaceae bacterium]|nr:TetR/AcrR family transcriptional regulator [Hyphomonadaceae bacterium]
MSSLLPKRPRRAEARPEEILEAALEEFNAHGFDAARVEDIASRAGISKGGVYLYFPSKLALLKALIEAKVLPIAQGAAALAEAGKENPLQALRLIGQVAAVQLADARVMAVPRLVISVSGRFPEIAEFYHAHVVRQARGALEQLIGRAMELGQMRRADVKAATRAFIGPLLFEAMWTHILKGETALDDPAKLIESQFDILLNGLELRA